MKSYWNSKSGRRLLALCFAVLPTLVLAQFSKQEVKFAKDETYLYPVNPGKPGSLAGTMGELRATHFHSGLDIRTNNMIGMPVLASKSGYISRAAMSNSSYGNVIYITHPDGNTTLYAHLDKFQGELAQFMLHEQYARKTGEIEVYFRENQLKVKQGETIALSGNSGSSGGPHLHFEIRDSNNFALNPLKVDGFKEIVDTYPPTPEKVAVLTLDANARINDRFGRYEFYGNRIGNNYVIASPILASGSIGVEILAKDKLAYRSPFYGGVNHIELWVDSVLVFHQAIEKLNIAESRAIYTVMDFKTMRNRGTRFYKLYIDDGNELKFYDASPTSGKVKVNPARTSLVQVKMKDSYGNTSTVTFQLKPNPVIAEVKSLEPMTTDIIADITENILMVAARPPAGTIPGSGSKAKIYRKGSASEIEPAYFNQNRSVYLIDLRKNIPDSVIAFGHAVLPKIKVTIPPGTEYKYYSDLMDIQFPKSAIYDTLYFNTDYALDRSGNEVFTIGSRTVPLHKSIAVSMKYHNAYPVDNNINVYRVNGNSYSFIGGERINDRFHFNTKEFGDFTILKDSIPPTIKPVYVNNQTVRFKIKDNLSGISSFQATVNGEWLLMHYDSKIATIWSERFDKGIPLKGVLELVVTDNAGNKSKYTQKIP